MNVLKYLCLLVFLISSCDATVRRLCGKHLTAAIKRVCTWEGEDYACLRSPSAYYDESAEMEDTRRIGHHFKTPVAETVGHCCTHRCDIETQAPLLCCREREARFFYRSVHQHMIEKTQFYRLELRYDDE